MSWSIEVTGTKEGVCRAVSEQLDRQARTYEGKPEGVDIIAAKEKILDAVERVPLDGISNGISVKANGSQCTTSDGSVLYMSSSVSVSRVALAL
jgi:hypothetical protein